MFRPFLLLGTVLILAATLAVTDPLLAQQVNPSNLWFGGEGRSGERIPEDPLELPGLVPAVRPRARVIPLDVQRSEVGLLSELLCAHDRRR